DRAVAAAQRQVEPAQLTSILYERGRLALDAGDRAAAERQWSELIDLAIVQPRASRAGGVSTRSVPSGNASPPPQRTGPLPATTSQFVLAATIAQAAAEHDLAALSLQAMKEALSG